MKNKKTVFGFILTALISLLLFTGCKTHHSKGEFALDYLTEVLDLTKEQETQLESIREELHTEAEKLHTGKKEMLETLKQQLAGDIMDKEILRQLVEDHRMRMDGIVNLAINRLTDFHSGLSPEQRNKLITKLDKMEKFHNCRFKK